MSSIAYGTTARRDLSRLASQQFPARPRAFQEFAIDENSARQLGWHGVLKDSAGRPWYDPNKHMIPVRARGLGADHGVYREMECSDGAVAGVVALQKREVSGAHYQVVGPKNPTMDEGRATELAASYLGLDGTPGMLRGGLRRLLSQGCRQFTYGFSLFELTWAMRRWGSRSVVVPEEVSWRSPWSILGWLWQGDRLVGARQLAPMQATPGLGTDGLPMWWRGVDIPANKLLLFTHDHADGNPEGSSALRPAWIFWRWKKDTIVRNQEAEERLFGGVSILKEIGDGQGHAASSVSAEDEESFERAFELLIQGALKWMTMPFGWDLKQDHPSFQIPSRVDELMYCDRQIFLALAAVLLGLDASHAGSKNLSDGLGALLWRALASAADEVVDVINGLEGVEETGLIRRLIDANFVTGDGFRYPKLSHFGLEAMEFESYTRALSTGYASRLLTPCAADEAHTRIKFGLPELPAGLREQLDAAFASDRKISVGV